jgi:hypothetical protein
MNRKRLCLIRTPAPTEKSHLGIKVGVEGQWPEVHHCLAPEYNLYCKKTMSLKKE